MIGCLVSLLLLLNTFYCSSGNPAIQRVFKQPPGKETFNSTFVKLQLLASTCENPFLATQIKKQIDACNFTATATLESKFECFIFYDINSQLCAVSYHGFKKDLNETFATRMNEVQKVQDTCEVAKSWKFTKLTEFPIYNNMSELLLKTPVTCVKACGVDDLLSEDTNFFCKYYRWGTEMLQQLNLSTSSISSGDLEADKAASSSSPSSTKDIVSNLPNPRELTETNIDKKTVENQIVNNNMPNEPFGSNNNIPNESVGSINNIPNKPVGSNNNNIPNEPLGLSNNNMPHEPEGIDNGKGSKDREPTDAKKDEDNEDTDIDIEDDTVPDDELEGPQSDPKLEGEKLKRKDSVSIESNGNIDMSHKVPEYANTPSDGFPVDDDHFFSFFLTAIILVILLYVLYHNKSKFRKVILGLLVEGRQAGRRRNSRGHEYRRLDTLEQAMSTNSAAPPSKIIY